MYPRDALVRPAERSDLSNFTERKRFPSASHAGGNAPDFSRCAARLGIRAPRNFYYRARGAREGPPIHSSRKDFGSFAYYAIEVLLIEIPATFSSAVLVFGPRGLNSLLKYVKLDSVSFRRERKELSYLARVIGLFILDTIIQFSQIANIHRSCNRFLYFGNDQCEL